MPPSSGTLSDGTSGSAAPGQEGRAEQIDRRWRHATPRALTPEGRDGRGMSEEEGRLLPHPRDQLVEIVGRRRACARRDGHRRRGAASRPYSGLLMSSLSCVSFTFSMRRRSCSWIWSKGRL